MSLGFIRVVPMTVLLAGSTILLQAQTPKPNPKPKFEVTSVKKSAPLQGFPRTIMTGGVLDMPSTSVWGLVGFAYRVDLEQQLVGAPDWIYTEAYAVSARAADGTSDDQMRLMVQSLLEDRFRMVAHWEQRALPHLELVKASEDGQLGPSLLALERAEQCGTDGVRAAQAKRPRQPEAGKHSTGCGSTKTITRALSQLTGQIVVDKTGLAFLDFSLYMPSDGTPYQQPGFSPSSRPPASDQGALRDAVRDQLGLKLEPSRAPVDMLVITSIERPTAN